MNTTGSIITIDKSGITINKSGHPDFNGTGTI